MKVRFHVPSFTTTAFRRVTFWLDENSDWWWAPLVAAVALYLVVMLLDYLPRQQFWSH